jgi:hypothetical protein
MTDLPVLISYSNIGYFPFAKNLLLSLSKTLRNHKVHFYCLDEEIMMALMALNITNIDLTFEIWDANVSRQFEAYGSPQYNQITHTKMAILKDALAKHKWIHFVDCDVVCMKEPTADFWAHYAPYDIVFQYDAGFDSADKPHWPYFHIWACTGNTLFRDTSATHRLLNIIQEYQQKYPMKNDQECLYTYFQDNQMKSILQDPLARLYEFKPREFTNGYWIDKDIGDTSETYFFHANHVAGSDNKIRLLRKVGQWFSDW